MKVPLPSMWLFCSVLLFHQGYTGNRFFTFPQFGSTSKVDTQSALCDFTNGYQFTKSAEWAPLPFYHASLDGEKPGTEIYPRSTGMIPSYKGHVPGLLHRWALNVQFNLMSDEISINFPATAKRSGMRAWTQNDISATRRFACTENSNHEFCS